MKQKKCTKATSLSFKIWSSITMLLLSVTNLNAQIGSYSFATGTSPYTTIVGMGATSITLSNTDDAISTAQTIPFTFNFGGTDFTSFKVNSNGWINIGSASTSTTNYSGALNGSENNVICVFNKDLNGTLTTSTTYYKQTVGIAPNRITKIEYVDIKAFFNTENPATGNCQVWLYETSNVVEMHYGSFTTSSGRTTATTVQVGLRGSSTSPTNVRSISNTGAWSSPTVGNSAAATCALGTFSIPLLPANGLVYTFTPPLPQCSGTPTPGNILASSNPVCANDSVTLSLQNPTVGIGVTYQWQESADGNTWTDIIGATNPTLTTPIEIPMEYKTCRVTCTNSGMTATANPIHVTLSSPSNCDCNGMPTPGNTLSSANPVCANDTITLSFQNPTVGTGVTYQWLESPDGINWTDINGATNATLTTPIEIPWEYKTCRVTCTNSGMIATANPVHITLNPFSNCYSIPVNSDNCSTANYITRVKLNNVDKSSGTCLSASYSDYSSDTIEVDLGKTYELTVEVNNNGTEHAGAWIDYNENAVFEASEFISLVDSDGIAPWIFKAVVVVPVSAISGTTSMLVRSSGSNVITAAGASMVYASGEIERYSVNKYKDDCYDSHVAFNVNQVANYCLNSTLVLGSSQPSTWLVYEVGEFDNCPDHEPNPIMVSNNSIVVINLTNPIFEKGKAYVIRRNVFYTTTIGDIITRHYVYCEHCITIADPQLFATVTQPTPCFGSVGIINYSTNGLDTIKSSPCPYSRYPPTDPCVVYIPPTGNVNLNTNIFPPGTYTLTATDVNGCTVSVVRTVNPAPPQSPSPIVVTANHSCNIGSSVINYSATGGTPPYQVVYDQPSPGITMTGTVLPGVTYSPVANYIGVYIITICDANNCCVTTTLTVLLPPISLSLPDIKCRLTDTAFLMNYSPLGGVFSSTPNGCVDQNGVFFPANLPIGIEGTGCDKYTTVYVTYKTDCRTITKSIRVYNCTDNCIGECEDCPYGYTKGTELLINGGFENDTYGWSTQLEKKQEKTTKEDTWYITNNAENNDGVLVDFDPILGDGATLFDDHYMIINAPRKKGWPQNPFNTAENKDRVLWGQQNIHVKAGVTYSICFKIHTGIKTNDRHNPSIGIFNGDYTTALAQWNNISTYKIDKFVWKEYVCSWTPTFTGDVWLNIRILGLEVLGQTDYVFGLDDISMTECVRDLSIYIGSGIQKKTDTTGILCNGQYGWLNASVAQIYNNSPVTFSWLPGLQTTSSIQINPTTNTIYTVTASNSSGVIGTATYTVEVSPLARTVENVTSYGLANGIITVVPYFGTPPYQYQWSNGSTIETAYSLTAGIFTVTVTDSNAVSVSDVIEVTQPDQMTFAAATNNTCEGLATGSIYINSITGGTPPYSIVWNTGDSTMSLYAKTKGTYWPIISDALGYSITDSLVISDTTCTNLCDTLSAQGNVYFNDFDDNQSITSELTNSNSCGVGTYAITTNAKLKCGTLDSLTNSDNHSGKLMVIQGGAVPNKKVWSTMLNITAGKTYHMDVIVYPQLDSLQNKPDFEVDVDTLTLSPGFEYHEMKDTFTPIDFTASTTGIVQVSIKQTNTGGVYAFGGISIYTCKPVTLPTATCTVNPVCAGGVSDSIIVIPTGDFPPLEIYWEDSFIGSQRPGLAVGTYRYVVVDNLGAEVLDSVEVVEAPQINITNNVVNVLCHGQNNGIISASINGGVSPLNYHWSNGQTTATATGLSSGNYVVTVTDANGCTATTSSTITEPPLLELVIDSIKNVTCLAPNSGYFSFTPTGGSGPYTYSVARTSSISCCVSDCGINPDFSCTNCECKSSSAGPYADLSAALYIITVTDVNGCTAIQSITITEPVQNCNATLNSCVYLQYFYENAYNLSSPPGLMDNGGAGGFLFVTGEPIPATVQSGPRASVFTDVDFVTIGAYTDDCVGLNSEDPKNMVLAGEATAVLQTNGSISVTLPSTVIIGSSYYLKVSQQNSADTWSNGPVLLTATTSYSFCSAVTQAFASNQTVTPDALYAAMFSGDINKDGAVDGTDFLLLDPEIQLGSGGYLVYDLNGDGAVDGSDFLCLDPNIQNGIGAAVPTCP